MEAYAVGIRHWLSCWALAGAAISAGGPGAAQDPVLPPAVGRTVDFAKDVHAILAEKCAKCHMGGARKGGLQLDTRELLLKGGGEGLAVVEGKSGESALILRVASTDGDFRMPPQGPALSDEEVGILRAWIDQGLPWTLETTAPPPGYVAPVSLREVQTPPMTEGKGHWNAIDRFIAAYWAERDIAPPPLVSDAAFARRVYLDTIGLLPPPEELKAFEAQQGQGKRRRLVESLLANDRAYAEHWMSFWNDLLRNDFQGTGYIDGGRKQLTAWLYRALYSNMPYNLFVRDLIAPMEGAEGFIKGIVWRGDNAVVQLPSMQAARNVSQVFLGVNLKCASCHDSFIDHWKLADAFGLANCFSEEPMQLVRCDAPTGEAAEHRFLWPELGSVNGALPRDERMARIADLVTTPGNGHFTRTIVNRLWAVFFGRGLVEPVDGIEREPWHPELLDWLARDFIENGYDLKHTMALILSSDAYQAEAVRSAKAEEGPYEFRGPELRRMTSEQFYDALSTLTGVWQSGPKFRLPYLPQEESSSVVRAWRVPEDPLSRALGRPNRDQVTTRRLSESTTLQAIELTNGATLSAFLAKGTASMLRRGEMPAEAWVDDLYLRALQRAPEASERQSGAELLGAPVTREGMEDLLWGLAMLPEFQLIL